MKKFFAVTLSFVFSVALFAQGDTQSPNIFKSNLKIYVAVAVLTIILTCIFVFLFSMERRLKQLEGK